jgi:hypothetical protein
MAIPRSLAEMPEQDLREALDNAARWKMPDQHAVCFSFQDPDSGIEAFLWARLDEINDELDRRKTD